MINVTKTFLPPFDEYTSILKRAWDRAWITNNGELLLELERKLKEYHKVEHLLFCSNGTIVIQMALKVYNITKEVITTPFSYVATTNAILWEGCTPVFVDIDPLNFCIDPNKIESAITENTEAILATHVYGLPCNVERIEEIGKKYNLKVIYDAAHAFGCSYNNKSLLNYGDLTTCSFHATKIFHTVEGGCIVSNDKEINDKLFLHRSFGHLVDDYYCIGVNGKNSEFHAAMGLAMLPYLDSIIEKRKEICGIYDDLLKNYAQIPNKVLKGFSYNYAYYPVIFETEKSLLEVKKNLEAKNINARRYFYPSLNTLPFLQTRKHCPVSEDLSNRVLCLPLYPGLTASELELISDTIISSVKI
jgi:dTDP-4-amino-4,6-dideoxygalactose transaminase